MRMSEESKGTTQTAPPADTSSAHRKPSAKEQAWEKNTLQPTLEKNPERQAEFTTISGYPIRRLYTPADLPNWDPDRELGFPRAALHARNSLHHAPRPPLDHAPVRRVRRRGRHQSALPLSVSPGTNRPFHCF